MNWNLCLKLFLEALLQAKVTIVIGLTTLIALLSLYLYLEAPRYKTSWVVLLPGTERASTINLDNLGEARSNGANAYSSVSISPKNTYREIALSDAVIDVAAQRYGVAPIAFSKPRITLIDQTPAMKFTLKGEDPIDLKYRAELFNETFHNTLDTLRSNEIERNFQGVEKKLKEAEKRLGLARQNIVDYQIGSSIVSEQQFQRWLSDAEELRTKGTQISTQLAELEATIERSLNQLGISKAQAQTLLTLQANPAVTAMLDNLGKKIAQQAQISSLFGAAHPQRVEVEREVKSLSSSLALLIEELPNVGQISRNQLYGLLAHSNAESIRVVNKKIAILAGLYAKQTALDDNHKDYLTRIKSQAENAAKLADLQRAHQIAEAIFSSALAKLDTNRLDIYATYPLTQLLTQPGATIIRDRLQSKLAIIASVMIYGLFVLAIVITRMKKNLTTSDPRERSLTTEIKQ